MTLSLKLFEIFNNNQSSIWILFLSKDNILYFPAQCRHVFFLFVCFFVVLFFPCVCTVNGIFIILIYLFKLTVFMEIFNHLLAVFKIKQKKVFLYFLFEAIYL